MISGVRFWSWRQPLHFTIGNKKSLVSLLVSKLCHIGVTSKTELLFGNSGVRRRSTTTKMLLFMYSLQVISWWAKNILSAVDVGSSGYSRPAILSTSQVAIHDP